MQKTNEDRLADLVAALKSNTAYSHIDIDMEMGKIDSWIMVHPGRKKTPRFVVAWLNRIEQALPQNKPKEPLKVERPKKPDVARDGKQCFMCHGDGIFSAYVNTESKITVTFRCNKCMAWEGRYGQFIPMWDDKYIEKGFVLVASPAAVVMTEKSRAFLKTASPATYSKLFGDVPKPEEKSEEEIEARKQKLKQDLQDHLKGARDEIH